MSGYQRIVILGNVGKDPELRHTQNGKAVCGFTVAVNDGGRDSEPTWFNIVTWERVAEACSQYVSRGSQVLVDGRVQMRSYEKDGVTRQVFEIVANNVQFIGSRRADDSPGRRDDDRGQPPSDRGRQPPPQRQQQLPNVRGHQATGRGDPHQRRPSLRDDDILF